METTREYPEVMYAIILDQISTCWCFENGKDPKIVQLTRLSDLTYCGCSSVGDFITIPADDLMVGKFDGSHKLPPMRFVVSDRRELLEAWTDGFSSFQPKSEAFKAAFELGQKFAREFRSKPIESMSFGIIG